MITISIVIPVKNGISTIERCLNAIFSQTIIKEAEVIIIDSGSTDGTLEVLKNYDVRLYQIDPNNFNHGATRNFGVSLANGEIIVMTVQDAMASDSKWLESLITPFEDASIAGVCGRQMIAHDNQNNPGAWTETFSDPQFRKVSFSKAELVQMSPVERKNNCGWDNVTAAYRKDMLQQIPFPITNYSEDIHWAWQMYHKGFHLGYAPQASVFHYHHENYIYRYKRHFIEITNHFRVYGLKAYPALKKSDLIPFYRVLKKTKVNKFNWLLYNVRLITANKMAESLFAITYWLNGEKGITKKYYQLTKEVPIGKSNL
ncbi:glycosyltransferase family 2 protein [Gelidibacter salicanalis]|uniref:Glycosyltransferase family 2 protein n=1 Tax=Gelidibacter salicanalis TaxID=291193 RepID=A0A5C7ALK6_9FLAO|nr:glycosyltransferase family 2 protein [Gelidibacter salicanalis]TXE09277.1 glycosyltransferase family 2 protein [Gelidibacter salicanalis]